MLTKLLTIVYREQDTLTLRRSQAFAYVLLLLIASAIVLGPISIITSRQVIREISIIVASILILLLVTYIINRQGWLQLALFFFLFGTTLVVIGTAALVRSPSPSLYMLGLVVVCAAAFGRPRDPLIWAVGLMMTPLVINLLLYNSVIPPNLSVAFPDGSVAPSPFSQEMMAIFLIWALAGGTYLTTKLLNQAIAESKAATAEALATQQAMAAQRVDLAHQNEQLSQTRHSLEEMVSALAVPVVPLAHGVGLLPLVGPVDTQRMAEIETRTLHITTARRMHALIIDLSGTSKLRETSAGALVKLCLALQLVGITPILAGIGPENALILSNANITLPQTVASVQEALMTIDHRF